MFKTISFSSVKRLADVQALIFTGRLFEYKEDEIASVDDYLHNAVPMLDDKTHVVDLRRITGNVMGDEGRTDVAVMLESDGIPNYNVLARLRDPSIKWVSDFTYNFRHDYGY